MSQTPTFKDLGVNATLLQELDRRGITAPTPIQHKAIPAALQGKDLIGVAQTGTGKTFGFGLPMLQHLAAGKKRALIVLPTRELAYQVEEALLPYAKALNLKTAVFVGGVPIGQQKRLLKQNPRILFATPGRLNDHLQQRTITLKEVEILVLDEADRMLDMGFLPQIKRILQHVPKERQTLLFSATMPQSIVQLATGHMHLPLRIEVAPQGSTAAKVDQELIIVRQPDKMTLLLSLLKEQAGRVLVFSRTKYGAKKITKALQAARIPAAEMHSNRTLAQRRAALEGFRSNRHRVLVATDIAARGIDVTGIELVVNYDLPDDPADYVHRIGRTGRADRTGIAISFATPTQAKNIRDIERLIKTPLPRRTHAAVPDLKADQAAAPAHKHRSGRGRPAGRRPGKRRRR